MLHRTLFVLIALLPTATLASDQIPGTPQQNPIALVGGTIYPVSGAPIENGVLVFAEGKIVSIDGNAGAYQAPEGTDVIDVSGKRIYPGMLDASSQIGLTEIGAVDVTNDMREAGSINPNAQVHVSVNPDSELIPTVRANGILLAHVLPEGGLVSGQGAVMQLDGWTYEDMTFQAPSGIMLNWPNMLPRQAWFITTSIDEQLAERNEGLQRIEDLFDQAERYRLARSSRGLESAPTSQPAEFDGDAEGDVPATDARLEAMIPLLSGDMPLFIRAEEQSQITAAVAFAKRRGLKLVIVGGGDSGKVAPLLAAAEVSVIIEGTQRMPRGRDADIDEAFALPHVLREAGVSFCISDDREPAFSRNLPYNAGRAVGFGLSQEDALASITLWPAQILGVANRVGSLEVGKDATLFIADGDILEIPTHVTHAWIGGRTVDLSSRHTLLNDKYKQRYGQE